MARQTLEQWIREALTDSDKEGPCTMLSLVHLTGTQQLEVHTTKNFGKIQSGGERQLAEMFRNKAEGYAQDLPGTQTFCMLAFYNGSSEPQARRPFMVTTEPGNNGLSTEPPTLQGELTQRMRHGEAIFIQTYKRQQQLDEYSMRVIEAQARDNLSLRHELSETFNVVRDAMMALADNSHKHRIEEMQFQRSSEERKLIMKFAPALVNTVLGREVFPQSTADTALLEAIAEKITEEDFVKLASVGLPPELMGPLAARFEGFLKKKREQAERYKQITEGGDPEGELQ